MVKRVLSQSGEDKPSPVPPVRQVVEVVEEGGNSSEALETIKKDAQEIEETVEELESTPEATEKQVVEKLFQKDDDGLYPEVSVARQSPMKSLVVWLGLTVGIALAVGSILVLVVRRGVGVSETNVTPSPTVSPSVAATSTPAASLARQDLKVQVLNGGGTAGAGSKMKQFLESKGYTVASVGNADAYAYELTEVLVKKNKEGYLKLLEEDLQEEYSLGSVTATLADDSPYDAQVIVGKQ